MSGQEQQILITMFVPIGVILSAAIGGIAFLQVFRRNSSALWRENAEALEFTVDRLQADKIDLAAANQDLRLDLEKERAKGKAAAEDWARERHILIERIQTMKGDP